MYKKRYMNHAIKLAYLGKYTTSPNPNVGCVIVKNNNIVGEGWHIKAGSDHAEINALKMAGHKSNGATAYITMEPCNHYGRTPPCCKELIKSGIKKVIISTLDPNPKISGKGLLELKKNGIIVEIGLLKKKAERINKGFFKRMKKGMPFVQLKLAISIDGKTALANGQSKWITSITSRNDVQKFRMLNDAILSTSKTIISDNSKLIIQKKFFSNRKILISTNKHIRINILQPLRIIIDSKNLITPMYNLFNYKSKIWLIRLKKDNNIWPKYVKQIILNSSNKIIDLVKLMYMIGKTNINNLWVESGASLAGSLIKLKLVDELILYVAPKILGDLSRSSFIIPKIKMISEGYKFKFNDIKYIGSDLRIILTPKY
ncbi:bifunctional diaminohydroxyphosphoribosylaminopyrimidine deaminase/5-amino-6-(5-phosphoribosylamino)uracil reductase RibD [Candidatus Purcelliella pentastirinorum]|uniref:bifunctional diaminohydroxyphosphoribosylaminopyrimidine deaminase/5-amino-6-(5-phosphoribosylamino)uracil reductase RibD n=1 Tax=Candidatus Purcelliella pentastirinorum TaxID=472834 RepID=UPI002367E8F0|nr:bifunctional diaminohydroxyphosphoribosylaminopyrimidine deaminase/5-amino-6-(5-phosphoribosylamino)uracil reductase RibD [Candidatus Purcelliella pentastirinorum]WDI78952.1 bifunctional diaminohydroxyphosphoribosylaminopyrimidine deaminase/5-amino-6-(5-phosphoribosylamino)uracil reductase RibD [Candidatus Purcelliella pentastirinorum]WDR80088.1 bifunctional diaminohydroxyphosphoribosylaminopyrimidine deaminase/5-amino-6-(5-phosphoribosylamino)uracil reductase RibD [Candidatus Purcelliella pen